MVRSKISIYISMYMDIYGYPYAYIWIYMDIHIYIASHTYRDIFSESCWIKTNLDCNYTRKSVITIQNWFDLIRYNNLFPIYRTTFLWRIRHRPIRSECDCFFFLTGLCIPACTYPAKVLVLVNCTEQLCVGLHSWRTYRVLASSR